MKRTAKIVAALTLAGVVVGASAQEVPFRRTVLQQVDISVAGREVVTAVVDFQPGGASGRHSHAGEEAGYILDGTFILERDDGTTTTLTEGEAFFIPAGQIHNATSAAGNSGRILATYVVEKGQPLGTPAPAR